ncbi:GNAT family N-acetyltransferase [Paenisporosarcina cavernae]|uniref:GNAT family N-acetyltransferase n=1 Tax=Paenisporosarcina cavernae TaxID=2320858 RepID=A0A385YWV3_9BACL|nr:GNAT family N-acetyltransferase [Paenisporosarcina cavernae]AYC30387.1 GNAT family N-acetyltransferase [Paenisporosarcina cavernae]
MIRAMIESDIPAVQDIAKTSWNDTYENIIPLEVQTRFLERNYSVPMMQKRLEKTMIYVAVHNDQIIGFANFTKVDEDGDAELTAIYLLPDYQKMGYGKQLLNVGLSSLKSASQLFVYVECENKKGRSFYENNQFTLLEEFEEVFDGHPLYTAKYVYYVKEPVSAY